MNTIDRFESTPVNRYQEQDAIKLRDKKIARKVHDENKNQEKIDQLHRQQQKIEQEANIRNKQIAKNLQVRNEGQAVDILA
jgi:hypothetical protein